LRGGGGLTGRRLLHGREVVKVSCSFG
jgi:hypothetical protein